MALQLSRRTLLASSIALAASLKHAATLFWSAKHFAFSLPGAHWVEVILLWKAGDVDFAVSSSVEIWVDYPVTRADNEVARLMLTREVGRFVALGGSLREAAGAKTVEKVISGYKSHPAVGSLQKLAGHKFSKVKKRY